MSIFTKTFIGFKFEYCIIEFIKITLVCTFRGQYALYHTSDKTALIYPGMNAKWF